MDKTKEVLTIEIDLGQVTATDEQKLKTSLFEAANIQRSIFNLIQRSLPLNEGEPQIDTEYVESVNCLCDLGKAVSKTAWAALEEFGTKDDYIS